MNSNQARRKILLDLIRQETKSNGGYLVSHKRNPILSKSPELKYLLNSGVIDRKLISERSWGYSTWVAVAKYFVPIVDASYLQRVRCPLCTVEIEYWTDMCGGRHKEDCELRHEVLY